MKRIIQLTTLFVAVAVVVSSCASPKTKKTVENLKAAITGETGASAKYEAFSAKATEEGYYNIAKMFAAAAAAEAIHIKKHNAVLVLMGEEPFTPPIKAPEVNSTIANLQAAIEGETYEFTVMYPEFIETATTEDCIDALESFALASEAEATHALLYGEALNILNETGSDETVASVWYVCPRCGDLFNTIEGLDNCPICGANSTSFKIFDYFY